MKQQSITILLTVVMSMLGTMASAYDIAVPNADGVTICYNYTNDKELEVTYQKFDILGNYLNMVNVVIPEEVVYENMPLKITSIGKYAFFYCWDLTSITIPNTVTTIDNDAFLCNGLTSIIVESGNPIYDSRNNCNAIIETMTNTLKIGCKTTIIPNSVTSIGEKAFSVCGGPTSIIIPNSVMSIQNEAFRGCNNLTSITIPNSVIGIGEKAFAECSGLKSIKVENDNTKYDSRDNCNAIIETLTNKLIIGCINTTIPNTVTYIGEWAFYNCIGLTTITIPNSVTTIGELAFGNCYGISSIMIPNSVTSIGELVFSNCISLTSITIPNSITSIGRGAFWGCTSLSSITTPNSLKSIGERVFADCFGIKDFYCWANNVPSTNDWAFDMTPCNSATLHVPAGSVDTYKNTYPWSLFGTTVALTDDDPKPTGINSLKEDRPNHPTGIYSLDGKRLQKELRGLNIIRMNNGKTTKSYFK